jgi:hypothetical protein
MRSHRADMVSHGCLEGGMCGDELVEIQRAQRLEWIQGVHAAAVVQVLRATCPIYGSTLIIHA